MRKKMSNWKVTDAGSQHQELQVSKLSSQFWGSSPSPSPLVGRSCTTPLRHSCRMSWWLLGVVMAMVVMLEVSPCSSLEARCLPRDRSDGSDDYCQCNTVKIRSGLKIVIKCDFQMKENVVLTENLYPFRGSKALSASVRLSNASSVKVTQAFLGEWLKVLSVGLDLWNCGIVSLTSSPSIYLHFPHSFSTFVGMGLVGCQVPEIPANLLRDRITASLRIKNCVVGTVRRGVISAVRKVGYFVVEDSIVEEVEGSVAAEGSFNLSPQNEDLWNGLILHNVTIGSLGPGSFNVTHKAKKRENTHKVEVKECQVAFVGRGGITAKGDVAVTIKDNIFGILADEALQVNVSRDFKFEENIVEEAGIRALQGLRCQNLTKLDKNTIYITTDANLTDFFNPSFSPFPESCSFPQVLRVVNDERDVISIVLSTSTWVLLAVLLMVVPAAGCILYRWRESNKVVNLTQENFHSYNGVSSSARYQANQQEVNMMQDGLSNPLYDGTSL